MSTSTTIRLAEIAHARSGDKGNHANIAVIANTQAGYDYLTTELTESLVMKFFAGLDCTDVKCYQLPKVWAMNFMLYNALAGGASQSLRIDTQGKLLGTAILELELPRPDKIELMMKPEN